MDVIKEAKLRTTDRRILPANKKPALFMNIGKMKMNAKSNDNCEEYMNPKVSVERIDNEKHRQAIRMLIRLVSTTFRM
jgi:hypothetical protein